MGEANYSLRFLTGKSQGSEIGLAGSSVVVAGRSGKSDLLLVDGMVSRQHARFRVKDDVVEVEDLGSANGTFVNGLKIRGAVEIRPGDRVLIGATILRLGKGAPHLGTEPTIEVGEGLLDPDASRASGQLSDEGLAKVLETYATDGQDAFIDLRFDGVPGFVAVHRGRIWDCGLDALPGAPALKVLFRMLSLPRGEFFVGAGSEPDAVRVDQEVAALLVEAKRAGDELDVLRQRLPADGASLAIARPLVAPLGLLDDGELVLFQLAHNLGTVSKILDASRLVDHEVVRRLLGLIDRGYLRKT